MFLPQKAPQPALKAPRRRRRVHGEDPEKLQGHPVGLSGAKLRERARAVSEREREVFGFGPVQAVVIQRIM